MTALYGPKEQLSLDQYVTKWDKETRKNIDNGELICVKTGVPLTQCVNLLPCAHKVQQTVADALENCPCCEEPVETYIANHYVSGLVQACLNEPESDPDFTIYLNNQKLLNEHVLQFDENKRRGIKRGELLCVKTGEPLTEGVKLNCNHRVQEAVAKSLKNCPLCNVPVKSYEPLPALKKIISVNLNGF